MKKIKTALISVFYKNGLDKLAKELHDKGVHIYSTGGTQQFIEELGIPVTPVETLTDYPSILGGRVKTLHPKVFGGILARRENENDLLQLDEYQIPQIDLVVVDLYPFEETVANTSIEQEIIEKIDIGGISLIRAAAKNCKDTFVISSFADYDEFLSIYQNQKGETSLEQRKEFAAKAFAISSHYDTAIFNFFNSDNKITLFKKSYLQNSSLRYGENPHQSATFYGDFNAYFDKLHGKDLSFNNLVDIDAAVHVLTEFSNPTFVIIKHTNTCGLASASSIEEAYDKALACDPVSAFGGILASNKTITAALAEKINSLFCEVVIAPDFEDEALQILKSKKKRILLIQKIKGFPKKAYKSILNGVLEQDYDAIIEQKDEFKAVTNEKCSESTLNDLAFAIKAVKHLKSNGIALVKDQQLIGMGCGQTSRVDALKQAINKAKGFGFSLDGAVMASDAFFPFPDCVSIAGEAGVIAVAQPGGSIKDQDSIDAANQLKMAMVFTGNRHFKH